MRDEDRIKRGLGKLERIWEKQPDLRFFQLLWFLGLQEGDLFNFEDDSFEDVLDRELNKPKYSER